MRALGIEDTDASSRRRAAGLHDATCNGSQGPCWCNLDPDDDDEVVYPTAADRLVFGRYGEGGSACPSRGCVCGDCPNAKPEVD